MKAWLCFVDEKQCSQDVQKKKLMSIVERLGIDVEVEIDMDSQKEVDEKVNSLISKLNNKALDIVLIYDIPKNMKKDDFSRLLDCCYAKDIPVETTQSILNRMEFNNEQFMNQQM